MKLRNYCIADMVFEVISADNFKEGTNNLFLVDRHNEPHIKIASLYTPSFQSPVSALENRSGVVGRKVNEGYEIYLLDAENAPTHKICADFNWSTINTFSSMPQRLPFEGSVGEVIFRNSILSRNGIVIHASAISYMGHGIIFSAPSGTGKSTQANLWRKYRGAEVLNGDRPALKESNDTVYVFGTPWSGSSPDFVNSKAPLSAIIMLEQSEENSLRQLSPAEAVQIMLPRCFMPFYDEHLMNLAFTNVSSIIKKVPIFLLKCRPDEEAVALVEKCLV